MGVVPAPGRERQRMAAEKAAAVQRCQCSSIVLAVGGAGCAVMEMDMDGGSGCAVLYVPAGWRRLEPAMSRCCALDVRVAVYAGE